MYEDEPTDGRTYIYIRVPQFKVRIVREINEKDI